MQQIPDEILKKVDKILFIYHLSLGDYAYLQNCFKQFADVYPHIKIHIWVDEHRKKWQIWEKHLKTYPVYDWLHASPFIAKIYQRSYSLQLVKEDLKEARAEGYPLIISLATSWTRRAIYLAREIGPRSFLFGFTRRSGLRKRGRAFPMWLFNRPNILLEWDNGIVKTRHISETYAATFKLLFGLESTPESRWPCLTVPAEWSGAAKQRIADWFFNGTLNKAQAGQLIFINPYSKAQNRCWTLTQVAQLVGELRSYKPAIKKYFIINSVPEALEETQFFLNRLIGSDCQIFSAQNHFFELPAMLQECSLVISVETAIMHLAGALGIPLVALMNPANPEWVPLAPKKPTVILTDTTKASLYQIPASAVIRAIKQGELLSGP